MATLELRAMERADWPAVAELIHASTNAWYERHARPPIFTGPPSDLELYCRVYEALDPGCCVLAEERGRLLGSCFYHPRSTHVSLGIMNVHPGAFGRGVARRLLGYIVEFADREAKPVRLVSSALNLDSFSLYNRAGFVPYATFQDMIVPVPDAGLSAGVPGRERVRSATIDDVSAMVALEREVSGIEREKDFRYFIDDRDGIWRTAVIEDRSGGLEGFLVSVAAPATNMLGPGVARTDRAAAALVASELDAHRGRSPVFLIPSDHRQLVADMYALGARNCELHFAQVRGEAARPDAVVMPTFMPETG